jgi:hypothetical protein
MVSPVLHPANSPSLGRGTDHVLRCVLVDLTSPHYTPLIPVGEDGRIDHSYHGYHGVT